jgi:hypothetical protein
MILLYKLYSELDSGSRGKRIAHLAFQVNSFVADFHSCTTLILPHVVASLPSELMLLGFGSGIMISPS